MLLTVRELRIYNSYFESDHRFPVSKQITSTCFRLRKPQNIPKYNVQALNNEKVKVAFCDKLESKLMPINFGANSIEEAHIL